MRTVNEDEEDENSEATYPIDLKDYENGDYGDIVSGKRSTEFIQKNCNENTLNYKVVSRSNSPPQEVNQMFDQRVNDTYSMNRNAYQSSEYDKLDNYPDDNNKPYKAFEFQQLYQDINAIGNCRMDENNVLETKHYYNIDKRNDKEHKLFQDKIEGSLPDELKLSDLDSYKATIYRSSDDQINPRDSYIHLKNDQVIQKNDINSNINRPVEFYNHLINKKIDSDIQHLDTRTREVVLNQNYEQIDQSNPNFTMQIEQPKHQTFITMTSLDPINQPNLMPQSNFDFTICPNALKGTSIGPTYQVSTQSRITQPHDLNLRPQIVMSESIVHPTSINNKENKDHVIIMNDANKNEIKRRVIIAKSSLSRPENRINEYVSSQIQYPNNITEHSKQNSFTGYAQNYVNTKNDDSDYEEPIYYGA